MSDRDLAPGTVLLDKYRVDEHLGVGGMGRVVRASHLYLQQSVAIKILLPQVTESAPTVARFLREAQAAVRLKSEHTVRVLDVGTLPDGRPYMVMEHLEGNDLNQVLRHHGPQEPSIVCDLMLQACEGLAEAHAIGIVHRDIKPSNFFITRRPDGSMLLKILDFGISKAPINYDDNLTQTHAVIGTPSYMAPEQMKSGRDADARSDIWSMGVVMYQLLHGRPPFAAASYAELAIQVAQEPPTPIHVPLSPGFGAAILRCLEKHPNRRHQNVAELARMLAPYSSDPITASQIANRTARILQTRAAQPTIERGALPGQQSLPVGANGGLAAPIPLSPAALSPRSWPPSPPTTGGRGEVGRSQLTHKTGGHRGWLLAGAMSLTILAATGGFIASTVMRDDAPATAAPSAAAAPAASTSPSMPPAPPAAAAPVPPAPPVSPTLEPTASAVPTASETATLGAPSAAPPTASDSAHPSGANEPTSEPAAAAKPSSTATSTTSIDAKPAAKTESTATANTESATSAKTETAASTTAGSKPAAKTESAATANTESATSAKTETAASTTAGAKPAAKTGTKRVTTPASKTATSPASKPATSPASKTVTTPTSKTATSPASKPATTPASKPVTSPASKPATSPASKSARPATKTTPKKATDLFNSRH